MGDLERGDVEGAVQILNSHLESGEKNHGNISPSIWRVPSVFRGVSPTCFDPCLVSIGPLHSEDKDLQEHQAKKQTYLYDLLERIGSPSNQTVLQECVQKVNASIGRIRACYKDLKTDDINDTQLVAMMVLDCCFIIELLRKWQSGSPSETFTSYILDDLILVENQIPFFVLEDIFNCTILKDDPSAASLTCILVDHLLRDLNPFDEHNFNTDNVGTEPHHILDLFHKCFLPSILPKSISYSSASRVKSVVELNRAGVKFKPNQGESWSMAMKYEPSSYWPWGRPTLKMPLLHIHDSTEKILRNLIAYEQFSGQVSCYFTSYAIAMDKLIDDKDDIAMLVESEAIINDLGSNGEAVKMVNSLCTELMLGDFFYAKEWKALEAYYTASWPKHIAWLRRTYFNSPWNAIALFAGIVLFILTALQTIFALKGTK